jgi:Triosephosphate isomerase
MTEKNADLSKLPMMAMEYVPEPNENAKKIVALVKDEGKVTGYELEDGRILNKEEAVELAKQDGIRGVGVASRKGNEYLKSLPDENDENNLGNLPSHTSAES